MSDQPDQSEKTEDPSEKKLRDAHQKGNVAKSQEVNSWFMMLAATLAIAIFANGMGTSLTKGLHAFLAKAHDFALDGTSMPIIMEGVLWVIWEAIYLPFLLFIIAAISSNLIQHGLIFSTESIQPKLSKISPLAGFKRLFSIMSLVNFSKSLFKLTLVTVVIGGIMWPKRDSLDVMVSMDPAAILPHVKNIGLQILVTVVVVYSVIAVLDYAYQRQQWWNKLKMTMQEVKDEHKQQEGDPAIRSRIRQIRLERGRKRMMAAIPDANVIITNPTHFAVALKYEKGMGAPVCLAKGIDALALKMRTLGEELNIPIVENPPLARALHSSVEIDEEIPPEHYKAVAEVIGYIMRLRDKFDNQQV